MMPGVRKLFVADLRYRGRSMASLGVGVAFATALFLLLAGLGLGLRQGVLGQLSRALPGHMVEVRPKHVQVGPLDLALGGLTGDAPLTVAQAQALAALPQVRAAHCVIDVPLPMSAEGGGALIGRALHAEIFMDALAEPLGAAGPDAPSRIAPFVDDPRDFADAVVPVLVSPQLVALYNTTVAPALGTPNLVPEALLGFRFDILVGRSQLARVDAAQRQGRIHAQVVGLSPWALPLGVSVPLATGRRLLRTFGPPMPEAQASDPSEEVLRAVLLEATSAEVVPALTAAVTAMGLHVDAGPVPLEAILNAIVWSMAGLGTLILALTGVGLMHAFAGYVALRGRELALVRAVGATRAQVLAWMWAEAACVGGAAGIAGAALAGSAAWGLNAALAPTLRGVPFLPVAPFLLSWPLPLIGVALATLTALAGAWVPAWRAAHAEITRATHGG